jgi:DNA-binding MarR family transcriptional regulator
MAKGLTYEQQRVLAALRARPDQTPTAYMLYACVRTLRSLERLGLVTSAKPVNTIPLRRIDMALGNTIRWQLAQAETESSYVK